MSFGSLNGLNPQQKQDESNGAFGQMRVDKPGRHLGQLAQAMGIDPAHAGLTPAAEALAKAPGQQEKPVEGIPHKPTSQSLHGNHTLGSVFANEIIRRLENGGEAALDSEGQPKDSDDLRHSLGQTMDWVRQRFGDDAAAAAAGMVIQSTSSGVTEDSLSEGLLNSLKFIDRNFGPAAGDEAIAQFNSNLNGAINEYFDNGVEELFHAVETPVDGASPMQSLGSRILTQSAEQPESDEETQSATEKLLAKIQEDLEEAAEMQEVSAQVEIEASIAVRANFAISAYTDQTAPAEPQFTSVAV